jgi:hypothetical protein
LKIRDGDIREVNIKIRGEETVKERNTRENEGFYTTEQKYRALIRLPPPFPPKNPHA